MPNKKSLPKTIFDYIPVPHKPSPDIFPLPPMVRLAKVATEVVSRIPVVQEARLEGRKSLDLLIKSKKSTLESYGKWGTVEKATKSRHRHYMKERLKKKFGHRLKTRGLK